MLSIIPGKPLITGSYWSLSLSISCASGPSAVSLAALKYHLPQARRPPDTASWCCSPHGWPSEGLSAVPAALPPPLLTDSAFVFHHTIETVFLGRSRRACPTQHSWFHPCVLSLSSVGYCLLFLGDTFSAHVALLRTQT